MDFLLVVSIVLLLAWSAYSVMRSRQKARQKAASFYSELQPYVEHCEFSKSTTQFQILSGIYEGYKVKLVPEVDKLVFQRLPRLYLRIYVYVPNTVFFRLRNQSFDTQSNYLFPPNSFESSYREIKLNNQDYGLFLGDGEHPLNIGTCLEQSFPAGDRCAELLFQANFIRVTILLAKGQQSSYILTRAADFSDLVFRKDFFQTYFQAVLELHKELNQTDTNMSPNL